MLMQLRGAAPQQGTWVLVTSLEHIWAMRVKAGSIPIFLEEQGTWMATFSRTWLHSSLSFRKRSMKATGSYSANLQACA